MSLFEQFITSLFGQYIDPGDVLAATVVALAIWFGDYGAREYRRNVFYCVVMWIIAAALLTLVVLSASSTLALLWVTLLGSAIYASYWMGFRKSYDRA
jgi:hypothetical protein